MNTRMLFRKEPAIFNSAEDNALMSNNTPTNDVKVLLSRRTHGTRDLAKTIAEVTDIGFDGMELALSSLGVVFGGRIISSELKQLIKITETSKAHFTLHAPLSLNFLDTDHIHSHIAVGHACIDVAEAIGACTEPFGERDESIHVRPFSRKPYTA